MDSDNLEERVELIEEKASRDIEKGSIVDRTEH